MGTSESRKLDLGAPSLIQADICVLTPRRVNMCSVTSTRHLRIQASGEYQVAIRKDCIRDVKGSERKL